MRGGPGLPLAAATRRHSAARGFVVRADWNCYIHAMMFRRPPQRALARKTMPQPIVLDDHARLPGRFFGRMTAGALAGL